MPSWSPTHCQHCKHRCSANNRPAATVLLDNCRKRHHDRTKVNRTALAATDHTNPQVATTTPEPATAGSQGESWCYHDQLTATQIPLDFYSGPPDPAEATLGERFRWTRKRKRRRRTSCAATAGLPNSCSSPAAICCAGQSRRCCHDCLRTHLRRGPGPRAGRTQDRSPAGRPCGPRRAHNRLSLGAAHIGRSCAGDRPGRADGASARALSRAVIARAKSAVLVEFELPRGAWSTVAIRQSR